MTMANHSGTDLTTTGEMSDTDPDIDLNAEAIKETEREARTIGRDAWGFRIDACWEDFWQDYGGESGGA